MGISIQVPWQALFPGLHSTVQPGSTSLRILDASEPKALMGDIQKKFEHITNFKIGDEHAVAHLAAVLQKRTQMLTMRASGSSWYYLHAFANMPFASDILSHFAGLRI